MKKYKMIIMVIIFLMLGLYFCSINLFVKADEENTRLIYLDPGHGGEDSGGTSKNGIEEKDINLKICFFLKQYLENSGYKVLMTRYIDCDLAKTESKNRKNEDILKRVDLINNSNALIYISIHFNIYSNESIKCAQTFYNPSNKANKELATSIQDFLKIVLQNTNRSAHSLRDKFLLDNVKKVGCLTEVGFLSNPNEESLLKSDSYQKDVAYAIYLGIINYFSND